MATAAQHLADIVIRDRTPRYRSRAAFAEAAGIKERTIAKIETAEPGGYARLTKDGVEDALHWVRGSFESVQGGGEPLYKPDPEMDELQRLWRRLPTEDRTRLLRIIRDWAS